jgi:hypothetical protein
MDKSKTQTAHAPLHDALRSDNLVTSMSAYRVLARRVGSHEASRELAQAAISTCLEACHELSGFDSELDRIAQQGWKAHAQQFNFILDLARIIGGDPWSQSCKPPKSS